MNDRKVLDALIEAQIIKEDDPQYNKGVDDALEAVARALNIYKLYKNEKRSFK